MKTKDLVYLGIIGVLTYLLIKKKPVSDGLEVTPANSNTKPVGNSSNGGLNLGSNMDLPSLTPTPADGLSTEVALNSSNVTPLIKEDNEPTQIFGSVNLPPPYMSTSVVNPNPVDVIPASELPMKANATNSTTVSKNMNTEQLNFVGNNLNPISSASTIVAEPIFPIKTIKAQLVTNEPNMGNPIPILNDVTDEMILECGNSFSIANNDREGSYTNYWFDGKEYYTQTTSPLMKSLPVKISKKIYADGCKKLQQLKMNNGKR